MDDRAELWLSVSGLALQPPSADTFEERDLETQSCFCVAIVPIKVTTLTIPSSGN